MELGLVDAVAEAVMGLQARRICVCEKAPFDCLPRSGAAAELRHLLFRPAGAFALQRLAQRRIERDRVVIFERRRLVLHLVRRHAGQCTAP